MALKGMDIFKLLPKSNCKKCGNPTCMAFAMKVASGGITIDKCPDISAEALAALSEASAPPMKALTFGKDLKLGGETVLFRHDKTFVSKSLYSVSVTAADVDAKLPGIKLIDYDRIGEQMKVDVVNVEFTGDAGKFVDAAKKAQGAGRAGIILEVTDAAAAKAALDAVKADKPILNGANAGNWEAFNKLATEADVLLGVGGKNLDEIYDTVQKLEGAGNKKLVIDLGSASIKETFANAVELRRAALKDQDRTSGYPSIVNLHKLAPNDENLQIALASVFTLKYGSIIILSTMSYAAALPLYGLRQNVFTDPQKPMKMEPKIYPVNGADENSIVGVTVDFALSYFVINGELERSGVPVNLVVSDAGGYSVLTSWAAGKFSAGTIAKFFKEADIEGKVKSRDLLIPGKVAVLKGELEENLPGWKIHVGPNEAVGVVKWLKDFKG
ncbi:acetyl-CoA decarbonylase/synthase complex subunit gamma [Breznakiellaceae bacterium SP9]